MVTTEPVTAPAEQSQRSGVELTLNHDTYLSAQERPARMDVIVTVQVHGTTPARAAGNGAGAAALAEVLVVDCSTSMTRPESKFRAARLATEQAIRRLPDGTRFAVVRGTHEAALAYPDPDGYPRADRDTDADDAATGLADATEQRRDQAARAVHALGCAGGTSIGSWLVLSRKLLERERTAIRHVLLLTDGKNEHDAHSPLEAALAACADVFTCDAWGIGDGWDERELLGIASRLHGQANAVAEYADLPAAYAELMSTVLGKSIPTLRVTVSPGRGCRISSFRQVFPFEMDLVGEPSGPGQAVEYATRAWGDERRRYQLTLIADPSGRPLDEDLALADVDVTVDAAAHLPEFPVPDTQAVVVNWTDRGMALSRYDSDVHHFKLARKLIDEAYAALDALNANDRDGTRTALRHALALAEQVGSAAQVRDARALLAALDDLGSGPDDRRLRLIGGFKRFLLTTHRTSPGGEPPRAPDQQEERDCPSCHARVRATDAYCVSCRHPLTSSR